MAINVATAGGFDSLAPHEWDGSAFRPLAEGWQWNGTGWDALYTAWNDSGLDKVGEQLHAAKDTWESLTGWSVRSGFQDTVIESNGIRVPAGTYKFTGQITYRFALGSTYGCRLVVDGQVVPGTETVEDISFGEYPVIETSATATVAAGLVRLQGRSNLVSEKNGTGLVMPGGTWWTVEAV